MVFPQFAELWKLIDLLVRKDFRQANLGCPIANAAVLLFDITLFCRQTDRIWRVRPVLHIVFSAKGDGTVTGRFHPPSLRSYGGQVENAILQKKVLPTRVRSSGMKKICGVQEPVWENVMTRYLFYTFFTNQSFCLLTNQREYIIIVAVLQVCYIKEWLWLKLNILKYPGIWKKELTPVRILISCLR